MNEARDPAHVDAVQLLENTHDFPCEFMVKVIGRTDGEFVARVVETVRLCQELDASPAFSTRETPNGRHVAVTLLPQVASAEEVLVLYQRIREIDGVVMLM